MIKRLLILIFIFSSLITAVFAQFPYVESFRNSTAPGVQFGGEPSAFLTAFGSSINGGTPIDKNGEGFLRLTNALNNQKGYIYNRTSFPSTDGLKVEFEYCIYGGNGADGISFFLFDATANPFNIGGFGGSLGYAQINTTTPVSPGVSKAYLAVGLDEFGNFSNPNEGRQGGTSQLAGSVTLRGKGNGAALTLDNYRYLVSQQTEQKGVTLVGDPTKRIIDPSNPGFRKVLIELIPNPASGYNINVKITKGGTPQVTSTIISNFHYPDVAPRLLSYGFASSTGAQTNFHEIRNVFIDLYNPNPIATSDAMDVCAGANGIMDITKNDNAYNDEVIIDKSSIDLNPILAGIQKEFVIVNQGAFSVNAEGVVRFVPVQGFIGTATANYTINDSSGLLSNAATLSFNYASGPSIVNAGPDKNIDLTTSGNPSLEGNNPGVNTARWTIITGPNTPIFTDPTIYNTSLLNLTSGTYVFRWTITSPGGCSISDDVQLIITNPPVANNDAVSTPFNTNVLIPILINDTQGAGTAAIDPTAILIKSNPVNGSVTINRTSGILTYLPNPGYFGQDTITYSVKNRDGLESNTATVLITVQANTTIPIVTPNINVNGTSGRSQTIIIIVPQSGSLRIVKQPDHGILTIDPVTGLPIYTADQTYTGIDAFTYVLVDANGNVSPDPGTVTINIQFPATIGLAKRLVSSVKNIDGTYNITYLFTLVNIGSIAIEGLKLIDDLEATFPNCRIIVNRLNTSGSLYTNPAFNGITDKNLLLPTSTMVALSKEQVTLEVNVAMLSDGGVFNNSAFTEGNSVSDGTLTSDISTDGLNPDPILSGDVSPNNPTPVTLIKNPLYIPKGFSPNNDGVNDIFLIENGNGRQILLEVYNRWGNRIYKSKEYRNDWNGITTEGIHIGDQVPVGTYYYVVIADNKDKYVGYITINR
jgi:gliding motility-associated-like protein